MSALGTRRRPSRRSIRRGIAVLLVLTTLVAVPVAPVLAQGDDGRTDGGDEAAESEGGLESAIEGFVAFVATPVDN